MDKNISKKDQIVSFQSIDDPTIYIGRSSSNEAKLVVDSDNNLDIFKQNSTFIIRNEVNEG